MQCSAAGTTSTQAHLRAQLLSKLCAPPTTPVPSQPKSLAILTTDLLIADYLQHRHYHYTLSVFQPEAGVAGILYVRKNARTLHIPLHRCAGVDMARRCDYLWNAL